jgi:hypothetical protein
MIISFSSWYSMLIKEILRANKFLDINKKNLLLTVLNINISQQSFQFLYLLKIKLKLFIYKLITKIQIITINNNQSIILTVDYTELIIVCFIDA